MKIAYFDCFSGVSGDMFLGALIHAGLPVEQLVAELRKLPLDGWHLHTRIVHRHHIAATLFEAHDHHPDAETQDARGGTHEVASTDSHHHRYAHEHPHEHDHSHEHPHPHEHGHHHSHDEPSHGHEHPRRGLSDILHLIESSSLSHTVKERAGRIFQRLGEAESNAHRIPIEEIHFHEVGAVDAIIDIVGASIAVELLGIGEIHASPLPVGRGFVQCAHGLMPIPVPGTMELLKGVPVYPTEIQKELVTPTGAAILTTLAASFGGMPEMIVESIGYGAGGRDLPEQPNMLRVVLGKKKEMPR